MLQKWDLKQVDLEAKLYVIAKVFALILMAYNK